MHPLAPCSTQFSPSSGCWSNLHSSSSSTRLSKSPRTNSSRCYFPVRGSQDTEPTVSSSNSESNGVPVLKFNGYTSSSRPLDWVTGGALDFRGATDPLTPTPLAAGKRIYIVRHGLSTWNDEGRIQGSSDLSLLTEQGVLQAEKCKHALSKLKFDRCYASPISRAKSSAEVMWSDRKEPLVFLDSLREANLMFLEGMKNEDAKKEFPEQFKAWREDPANFSVNGVYPVVNLWSRAKKAWSEMLEAPGELLLVVTHKSILRALICTALGLQPERFRSIDVHNSAISSFIVNKRGEPMLDGLNLTAHLYADDVFYF